MRFYVSNKTVLRLCLPQSNYYIFKGLCIITLNQKHQDTITITKGMRKKRDPINMTAQMLTVIQTNFKPNIFRDTEQEYRLKSALNHLSEVDRRIIILYAEYSSIRDVAKILNTTYHYVSKKLKEIRNELHRFI